MTIYYSFCCLAREKWNKNNEIMLLHFTILHTAAVDKNYAAQS